MNKDRCDYYIKRKGKLLKSYDKTAKAVRDNIVSRYGEEFADSLIEDVRKEFEALMGQMPYISHPVLRTFLIYTCQEVAVYKAMKRRGKDCGQAWEICHEALRARLKEVPTFIRWLSKKFMFTTTAKRLMKRRISKMNQQSDALFRLEYVEGEGDRFNIGVNYTECGLYKFVCDQGAEEFAPYVCMSDIALSDIFGWGL
ncbi:MAG: L-2-amino-thiazoline-4-carboxylic acid hydrolase, partial [Planctomycetota bacterium]